MFDDTDSATSGSGKQTFAREEVDRLIDFADTVYKELVVLPAADIPKGNTTHPINPGSFQLMPLVDDLFTCLTQFREQGINPMMMDSDEICDAFDAEKSLIAIETIRKHQWVSGPAIIEQKLKYNTPFNKFIAKHKHREHFLEMCHGGDGQSGRLVAKRVQDDARYTIFARDEHAYLNSREMAVQVSSFHVQTFTKTMDTPLYDIGFSNMDAHHWISDEVQCREFLEVVSKGLSPTGEFFLSYPDFDYIKEQTFLEKEEGWYQLLGDSPGVDGKLGSFIVKYYEKTYIDPKVDYTTFQEKCSAFGLTATSFKGGQYMKSIGLQDAPKHLNCIRVVILTKGLPPPVIIPTKGKNQAYIPSIQEIVIAKPRETSPFPEAKGRLLLKQDLFWFFGDTWWVAPKRDGLSCCARLAEGKIELWFPEYGDKRAYSLEYYGPAMDLYCEAEMNKGDEVKLYVLDVYQVDGYLPLHTFADRWQQFLTIYWGLHFAAIRQMLVPQNWKPLYDWTNVEGNSPEGIVLQNISSSYAFSEYKGRRYGFARYIKWVITKDVMITKYDIADGYYRDPNNIFVTDGVYEVVMHSARPLLNPAIPNTILRARGRDKKPNSDVHIEMLQSSATVAEFKAALDLRLNSIRPVLQVLPKYAEIFGYCIAREDPPPNDLLLEFAATYPCLLDIPDDVIKDREKANILIYKLYLLRFRLFRLYAGSDSSFPMKEVVKMFESYIEHHPMIKEEGQ